MSSIQLNPVVQSVQIEEASAEVNAAQLQALISAISSTNPPLLTLPEGKTFADVKVFTLHLGSVFAEPLSGGKVFVSFK